MKSVKRGRGPSCMGGMLSLAVAAAGIAWTAGASAMGAPGFFPVFGICFTLIALGSAAYNFVNAASKNRFSEYDITSGGEEPDPLNERFGERGADFAPAPDGEAPAYCPYCGAAVSGDFRYCGKCGKKLPAGN